MVTRRWYRTRAAESARGARCRHSTSPFFRTTDIVRVLRAVAVLVVTAGVFVSDVSAQETRTDLLRAAREEKQQKALEPPEPGFLESTLKRVERAGVPLITRDGIYAKLGSITTGSGFAYGGGYRTRRFLDRYAGLDVWGAGSIKGYWAAQARVQVPLDPGDRIVLIGYGRRHAYTQEDYFGLGPDSLRSGQTDYRIDQTTFGGRMNVRLVGPVAVGGGVEFVNPRVEGGSDKALPSIDDIYNETTAPGLAAQPNYVRTLALVDIDYREPQNPRGGGWYRFELSHYDDRETETYTFNRLDVNLQQYVSIFAERRIFAARLWMSTSDAPSDHVVPFYMMPTLGGNDSLRGFRDYRFRAPHALLLQGEYRFEIWSGLDGALFYDAGKVTMERKHLDFNDLETDYGFGFRFNTDNGIIFRVDTAFGSDDGTHLWIVFGGLF